MAITTDCQSSRAEAYSNTGIEEVNSQEGRLGANTICTQPQDRKTLKILNRIQENMNVSQGPNALELAADRAKEQITRTRIRNEFTPVPKDIAPESTAIAALRERLL